jgi:thiol-disulfide isomerase/thioredoxin
MKPVVDRLREEYGDDIDFRDYPLDKGDPEAEALARSVGLRYVPTFLFAGPDGTVVERLVGEVPEETMREAIESLE